MRSAIYYGTAALATLAWASPTGSLSPQHHGRDEHNGGGYHHEGDSFKDLSPYLPDGFPSPSLEQINEIQERAHGTLPNTPLPSHLSKDGITNFKLIAFNELFEVAFFFELVQNITNNVDGYELDEGREEILDDLTVILAVEELHALGANAILQANGVDPIKPCRYNFPVSDYKSAIALAATFTDVVLGALQDVNDIFAQNAENGPVRLISSVIGHEGEQESLFRIIQKKTTPAQPFLTTSTREFAFTAVHSFVVPGSCPNIGEIPLQTFQPLNVLTQDIGPMTKDIRFSFSLQDVDVDLDALSLVLINAQNKPIVKKLENIEVDHDHEVVTFAAECAFNESLFYGLTITAVTHSVASFDDAGAVAKEAIFGPGLIEVN
ncbi:late sexual development protein [Paraphaeosphaeria sporulosa]